MAAPRKTKASSRKVKGSTHHWQDQARRILDDGVKLLRTRLTEAEGLAEQTANVAKLQLTVGRNQLNRYKMLYDLGKAVWDSFPSDESTQSLTLNEKIRRLAHRVRHLDDESRKAQRVISSFPTLPKGKTREPSRTGSDEPLQM
jgi:hypothetical protein